MMWKTGGAGFSPNPEIVGANAIMADCTYANVLADTLGLSPLTTDAQINSHLRVVLRENDSPYGFIVQTGRYPSIHDHGDNDNSLWMMANPDWATLALWRGFDPNEALAVARKTLDWWRTELKDMWNVVAVGGGINTSSSGQPLANSHYGYHMTMWHMIPALVGQFYDAPSKTLQFAPKMPAPFELPVLVPGTALTLSASTDGKYELKLLTGVPLQLDRLAVGNASAPGLPRLLSPGDAVQWEL
jgi:non-lysosomal glucosylceramidase